MDILDEKTVQKIDFIIQGVVDGQFEDFSEKIEFYEKLKDNDPPQHLSKLLTTVHKQGDTIEQFQSQLYTQQTRIQELEDKLSNYYTNMRNIANALGYLSRPDPFAVDTNMNNIWDLDSVSTFIHDYKNKY